MMIENLYGLFELISITGMNVIMYIDALSIFKILSVVETGMFGAETVVYTHNAYKNLGGMVYIYINTTNK